MGLIPLRDEHGVELRDENGVPLCVEQVEEKQHVSDEGELGTEGPTFEEYVAAGYLPEHYPPEGYVAKASAGWDAYREEVMKNTTPASSTVAQPE